MIYIATSMRDEVHQEFSGITLELSTASALRNFSAAVMSCNAKQEGLLFTNPQDFSLWKIGDFDSESGSFVSCIPELIARGSDF